jgi:hypothetical protein
MPDEWRDLIALTGIPKQRVQDLLDGWLGTGTVQDRIGSVWRLIGPDAPDAQWLTSINEQARLRSGIYSPLQLLGWECAKQTAGEIERDFPFLFSWASLIASTVILNRVEQEAAPPWPPDPSKTDQIRHLLQALFRLREQREEHEPLSLEVHLPLPADVNSPRVPIKRLAQVFGRGIAVVTGDELYSRATPHGAVSEVWRDHGLAPTSRLYRLQEEYANLDSGLLGLTLRRDGLLTIGRRANPLLEFYDGGWHIVDLDSGRVALKELLDERFTSRDIPVAPALPALLVQLAYHMASHWHGGILAVVDEAGLADKLHEPSTESTMVTAALNTIAGAGAGSARLTEITEQGPPKSGLGRLFLTLAIQDGATLFRPDGSFIGASRFVKDQQMGEVSGGSGARAARTLACHGVAIKISADGAIRVFARLGTEASPDWVPEDGNGLRIR